MLIYSNTITQTSRGAGLNGYPLKYYSEGYNKGVKIYNNILTTVPAAGPEPSYSWGFIIESHNSLGGMEFYNNTCKGALDLVSSSKGTYNFAWDIHDNTIGFDTQSPALDTEGDVGIRFELNFERSNIYRNHFKNLAMAIYVSCNTGSTMKDLYVYYNLFDNLGTNINGKGWALRYTPYPMSSSANTVSNWNIWNNVILAGTGHSTAYGIQLPYGTASGFSVRNNIIIGFSQGAVQESNIGTMSGVSIENNIFNNNGNSNAPIYFGSATIGNNIIGDPLFVSSSDYHLKSNSPAISKGIYIGLTSDYEGKTVSNPPEIGAYEYSGTATCTPESDSTFCSRLAKSCGSVVAADNCGTTRTLTSCGSCATGYTCSVTGQCLTSCTISSYNPALNTFCGSKSVVDNCGVTSTKNGTLTCSGTQTCTNNVCVTSNLGSLGLSFSFTQIPSTDNDLVAPGRGAENWNGVTWDDSSACKIPAGNSQALDSYVRFNWNEIETATQGVYTWTRFDSYMNRAIDAGQKFSFGIMTAYPGEMAYPNYLHNLMQTESTKDWQSSGTWVPNWNSPNYIGRYSALLQAIANHLDTTSRNGVLYKNAVGYIDIRGYGNYGEWHLSPFLGTPATSATLRTIIDAHKEAFPNYQLVAMVAGFYSNSAGNTPTEISYYLLTTSNNRGQIGWRRDQWGDSGMDNVLQNNPGSYSGVALKSLIMDKWKYAPVLGETQNTGEFSDLDREIKLYHAASFGNGNYPSCTSAVRTAVTASSKDSGYRIILEGGGITSPLVHGSAFQISLNWKNIGIAPTYEDWNVVFELRNSNGAAVWTGTSSFNPRLFLPGATTVADNFALPSSVTAGSYKMYLIIKDPNGYRKPLPLAITGRNTDGSYLLGSITIN